MLTTNIHYILDNDICEIYFNKQRLTNSKYYQDNINVLNYIINEKNNNLIINYNDKYIYAIYLLNIAINSYLNNTLNPNNHILTKLDKGMPLLYKGQIVIFKNINNDTVIWVYKIRHTWFCLKTNKVHR